MNEYDFFCGIETKCRKNCDFALKQSLYCINFTISAFRICVLILLSVRINGYSSLKKSSHDHYDVIFVNGASCMI